MTNPRLLHTMLRVRDLDASVAFYTKLLGMKELRRNEVPGGRYTLAFVGYGDESDASVLELPDVYAACDQLTKAGGKVTREAGPVQHGTTVIAFVEDPDGYKVELVQRA